MKISQQQMTALEDLRRPDFAGWLAAHSSVVGAYPADLALRKLDAVRGEAEQSGIDTEQHLFAYAAARILMPAMNAIQYFRTMDLVFAKLPDTEILRRLVSLRDCPDG